MKASEKPSSNTLKPFEFFIPEERIIPNFAKKMQRTFITLILLATWSIAGLSQSRAGLEKTLDRYMEASVNKDWEAIMDMVYPKLFDIVSREMMIETFKSLDGQDMAFSFEKMEVKEISDLFTHESEVFARIDYTGKMSITLLSEDYKSEDVMEMMLSGFQAQYGEEHVSVDPAEHTFHIDMTKSMFAIADEGGEAWRFLENNTGQEAVLQSLIPQAVRDQFPDQPGN